MHELTQLASVWTRLSTPNPAPHLLLALLGIMKSMCLCICGCVWVHVYVCVGVEDYSRKEKNKSYLHSEILWNYKKMTCFSLPLSLSLLTSFINPSLSFCRPPPDTNAESESRSQSPLHKCLRSPQENHTDWRLLETLARPQRDDDGRGASPRHVFCLLRKHEKDFKCHFPPPGEQPPSQRYLQEFVWS